MRQRHTPCDRDQRAAIREVKARLQLYEKGLDMDDTPDDVWESSLVDILLPAEEYVAGFTQQNCAAWSEWISDKTPQGRAALDAIREGLKFDFVQPTAECQTERHRHSQRLQQLQLLLSRLVGKEQASSMLQSDRPAAMHFPNREWDAKSADFVHAEASRLREAGALRTWQELGMQQPPLLIHGLGVVENRHGKLRLVVDARYLNLFLRYLRFKYQGLQHVINLLQQFDWMYTTDFKSGYHQIPLHPDCWTYMGVQIEGEIYVLPFLPFGVAPACRQFTEIMQQVYLPLQQAGQRICSFIDDSIGAAHPRSRAKYHVKTLCLLQTALGFFDNIPKSQLRPDQVARHLGMILDTISTT